MPQSQTAGDGLDEIVVTANANRPAPTTANTVVTIDYSGYMHIAAWHMWFPFPNTSRYLAQYRNVSAINKLLTATLNNSIGFPQANGYYYFSADLAFAVGTDQSDALTQWNTAIVRITAPGYGEVVTMYPGQ